MDGPALLEAIRTTVAELAARPRPVGYGNAKEKREVDDALTGRVRLDFVRWLGRPPTSAEHRAAIRTLHRLAATGRVELVRGPTGRVIAVRLNRTSTTAPGNDPPPTPLERRR
jgi:hypothetical protein